ncbi:MAG: hypothetical protein J6A59_03905, partial [Lachnospiraceae bacterium]|nr:hypothetical protein [Lachnospiraceae bacterium]
VEKTQKFKMYTVEQTKALLNRFKFVNAELKNGKITNTECAMTRMPKFNTQMQVIGNHGIIILGEIVDGSSKVGYRVMDTQARIIDINEAELVKLVSNCFNLVNAKIVRRESKDTVSAIKSEFTKIEKSKLAELNVNKSVSRQQLWRNRQHINKILSYSASVVLTQIFTKPSLSRIHFSDNWAWRESTDIYGRFYEPLKEYKIFCKEIGNEVYGCKLSDRDKDILVQVGKLPKQDRVNYCRESLSNDTKYFMLLFLQLALNNKDVYSMTLYLLRRSRYRLGFNIAKTIVDSKLACDKFKALVLDAKIIYKDAQEAKENRGGEIRKLRQSSTEHEFRTKTFTTGKEMAQLGFTISEDNSGVVYRTDYGYRKTLLYLGDIIGSGYNNFKSEARCLGDLAAIAYVEKLIHIVNDGECYGNMSTEEILNTISIIITIAYMFNSTAMKNYVEAARGTLEYEGVAIPDYDDIAGVDYKLNNWITMYYASGFNVFLSDDEAYQYKHTHLANAEIINYRQLGVKHNIIHPMLQDDFASVVSLITPASISGEEVTKIIGGLRFL